MAPKKDLCLFSSLDVFVINFNVTTVIFQCTNGYSSIFVDVSISVSTMSLSFILLQNGP